MTDETMTETPDVCNSCGSADALRYDVEGGPFCETCAAEPAADVDYDAGECSLCGKSEPHDVNVCARREFGLKAGDRVELVHTTDEYIDWGPGTRGIMLADEPAEAKASIPITGPEGEVITEYRIVSVKWDNGSWLQMIPEAGDQIKKVDPDDLDTVCPKCKSAEHVTSVDFHEKPEGGWWSCSECNHKFQHRIVVPKVA